MRILFITQWFWPESFYKGMPFAKKLMACGHQVQVLTGFPNYPAGKIYPGYKIRFFQREVIDGVEILRVPLFPSHDSSAVGRIANYLSFAVSASIVGPWVVKKADVAYVYHPPATVYLPAFFIKLFRRIRLVYDIQDFWPDTLAATGMFNSRWGLKAVDLYCRLFYRFASKIVVLGPGFKHKLVAEKSIPADKIEIIYNWCDDSEIIACDTDMSLAGRLGMAGRFNVLFAGNMGKAQKLRSVIEAAKILAGKVPAVQFVFIGGGVDVPELKKKAEDMNLANVKFLSPRPPSQIGPVLGLADVLLVHLGDDPLFRITIPSKLSAYMAVAKPILAAVSGDAADLVSAARAGLVCPPDDPQRLAETVLELYRMPAERLAAMGRNGQKFYRENLAMDVGVGRFEKIFLSLSGKFSPRSSDCTAGRRG